MKNWIIPQWPAPENIKAYSTTRQGGCSQPPYDQFNLGDHVGDDTNCVAANRQTLKNQLDLPNEPVWLNQIHGVEVAELTKERHANLTADASITSEANQICTVLTADCLPVLFCNKAGTQVAAAHAGWKGLAAGVLKKTVDAFVDEPTQLMAWLGPAIGPEKFEVGDDVYKVFIENAASAHTAFKKVQSGKWLANIYQLARQRLNAAGLTEIYGGDYCTYTDERFYSYRRDKTTGRMASLIFF